MIVEKVCIQCGKRFCIDASRVANGRGKNCSRQCMAEGKKGKAFYSRPYTGKNYKIKGTGGVDHHLLHREIAEKALGKPLPEKAVVHHVNGTKIGSLVICEDRSYHNLIHVRMRAYAVTGDAHKRKCTICKQWDDPSNLMFKTHGQPYHSECRKAYRKARRLSCL
jgi:hypothetical protein